MPGPGTYNNLSTLKGPKFSFGGAKRYMNRTFSFAPGPGAYKIPCTFAHAENYKLPQNKTFYSFV